MSRVDDLIAQFAPGGVLHCNLQEVAAYSNTRIDASTLDETTFVGVDNLVSNKAGKVCASYLPNAQRLTAYDKGDVLLGNIRPYLKKIWLATDAGGCSGDVLAIRIRELAKHRMMPAFLYYLLSSDAFFAYDVQHAKGAKMPRGSKEAILNYRIPVPPVEVQREIVLILDLFSTLEAELEVELEAELEARQLQYAYCRDSLLAGRGMEVRWVPLGHLGTFTCGCRFINSDFDEDGFPCIHYGEIYTHYGLFADETKSRVRSDLVPRLRIAQPGDLVVVGGGENVEEVCKAVAWLGESPVAVHDECYIFHHSMHPKYASYVLSSGMFRRQKTRYANGAKIIRVSIDDLAKIEVPVPDKSEQERIVGILDRFEGLVKDLSVGLPAELKARRRQYEYYRDKLLTFEEAVA